MSSKDAQPKLTTKSSCFEDTKVFDIGPGCQANADKMTALLRDAGDNLGIPVRFIYITEDDYNKDHIELSWKKNNFHTTPPSAIPQIAIIIHVNQKVLR